MIGTWVSILPPIIAIVMVLVTRRVLLSLGAGILTAALLIAEFAPLETLKGIWTAVTISFWDGGLNTYNIFIMLFLLLLGVITAFVSLSGGSAAFARWAVTRIRTKRGAKLLTMILGIAIFVDDYFNALAVGQIARPITDQHRISRAKLAYFIDSTSAPICVVSPISSWGAFLIGQLALILGTTAAVSYSPLTAFIMMAPMNFYVIATLSMVFFFAWTNNDFFEMKKHEDRANNEGLLYDPKKEIPGELKEEFPEHTHGKVRDLVAPIVTLIAVTLGMMIYTGYKEAGIFDIWAIFENTDVPFSLVTGGITATLLAMLLYALQMKENETASVSWMGRAFISGIRAMMPAILILILAWGLTELIATLDTGLFLSTMVEKLNIPVAFLPVLIFILAGLMAFSTGTSWGSFGILMPIAGTIMVNAAPELLLPALSAVLAGAVFGDHCSPISDTTILSSTGAGCNHIDHVATQLPYALVAASVAVAGYFTLGVTGSVWIGLAAVIIILIALFVYWNAKGKQRAAQTA
ncbi:sodium:proton antiporter [Sporosarcina sp. P37]|uniref:Na+/H+ antiporter NhaC family protein n=1 Tax=unclassified Sporosarcina TaxID=2647733 RepID=UPI0009BD928C|nr:MULTISPECIES: Na+/H+ antiporter NhaC family protein [unclassified Sporosarcina]ARD47449.1 sodium:proton antiporter [Sporosarcina sp. P33]ARK24019.1 sodium:proton antiporter [Sporosarcina sp. P37]PID18592.1 sodium:proton antiporter [Sporosarcina sp. P35]